MQTQAAVHLPETTEVYVNFYQNPDSLVKTSSLHPTRQQADAIWNNRWANVRPQNQQSKKQRVACIKVSAVCINGQFDY